MKAIAFRGAAAAGVGGGLSEAKHSKVSMILLACCLLHSLLRFSPLLRLSRTHFNRCHLIVFITFNLNFFVAWLIHPSSL